MEKNFKALLFESRFSSFECSLEALQGNTTPRDEFMWDFQN